MAMSVTVNGAEYLVPLSVSDITLDTHLRVVHAEKDMPAELRLILEADTEGDRRERASKLQKKTYARKVIPYFAGIISTVTGIPKNVLLGDRHHEGAPVKLIEDWYWHIMRAYTQFQYNESRTAFHIGGKTWTLPKAHMQGSTFGEFAEAAQYEEYVADVAAGNWDKMPYVMAVLLRPEGEKFDPYTFDDIVEERAALMRTLTMDVVYQVSFFLLIRNDRLKIDSLIYMVAHRLGKLKQGRTNSSKVLAGTLA